METASSFLPLSLLVSLSLLVVVRVDCFATGVVNSRGTKTRSSRNSRSFGAPSVAPRAAVLLPHCCHSYTRLVRRGKKRGRRESWLSATDHVPHNDNDGRQPEEIAIRASQRGQGEQEGMYIRNSGVENKGDESDAIVKSATGKIDRALRMVFLEYYSNHEVESCILPLRHVVDNSAPLLRKKVVNAAELAEVVIAGLLGRAEKIELRLPEVTGAGESVMTSAALGTPSIRLELWWRGRAYHVYEDDIAAVARWMELIVETMRQTKKYGWAGSRDEEKDEEERWAGADAMARLQEEIEQQRLMETDGVEAAQGLVSLVCRAIRDGVAPQAIITERNIRSQDYQDPLLAQATPSFDDDEAESTPMMVKKEQFELPKEGRQSAEEQERDERRAEKLALDRRRAQLEVHLVAEAYAWCTRE